MRRLAGGILALAALSGASAAAQPLPAAREGGIAERLPGAVPGDAARGRAVVASRQVGLCLLCHSGPIPEERFQGNLAPNLSGAGLRWTEAQLRLRIADSSQINPDTIMPSYFRSKGFTRLAPALQGKSILTAQQIEDVVAYLLTLREAP